MWCASLPLHAQTSAVAAGPANSALASPKTRQQDTDAGKRCVAPKAEILLLDVRINHLPLSGIIRAECMTDGRLALPAEAWTEARLRPAGAAIAMSGGVRGFALEASPGVVYTLDRSQLALDVTAPAAAYESNSMSLATHRSVPTESQSLGVYLNYDISADHTEGLPTNYGALLEAVAFGGRGALVNDVVVQGDDRNQSLVRTDTYWQTDLPGRMETLVIGDTISSAGAWSQPVRYSGVRYARDFTLAPSYITYPMPSISGSAALPSTVDVLINDRRATSSTVQPGPFELTNVPTVTGAGQMQVVVRDLLGRETVVNQSYYIAPVLLAPGLADFSFEAGSLRENYGTKSDDYGAAFGAGTYRLGFTDAVTAEVRAEAQRGRSAAGTGIAVLVDELAVVGLAAGYAVSDGERGGHYVASIQRTTAKGGTSISFEHFDQGYRALGAVGTESRPKDQWVASTGITLGLGITQGLSYVRQTTWDGTSFALMSANLGIPLPGNIYLSIYASKQMNSDNGYGGGINLILPLGHGRTLAESSVRDPTGHEINTLQATQSTPTGPGWGWQVAASDSSTQRLQAGATYNGNNGQVTVEGNAGADANALRIGANGSVGWMEGLAFASRRIDQGAFAVVHVGDLDGVPISLSNQVVSTTNDKGLALVTGLLPYQSNQLTLNADQLPFDVQIGGVQQTVVPYARSGAVVNFSVKRSRDVLVVLSLSGGTPVPAGARVLVTPGNQEFIVARRGEVYLMDVGDDNRLEVHWKDGGCTLPLKLPHLPPGGVAARIGPLTCGAVK